MLNPRAGCMVCWRQRHQQPKVFILTFTSAAKGRSTQSNMIADYLLNLMEDT